MKRLKKITNRTLDVTEIQQVDEELNSRIDSFLARKNGEIKKKHLREAY